MDPFEKLPADVFDNLLGFFSAHEVLNILSLVSKHWYDAVAASNVCMKKIHLNLRAQRKTNFSERLETIRWMSRKGGRAYQHLQINCLLDERISHEIWSFLDSQAGSVESINIRSMKLDETLPKISLPKLEQLKMMFVPREAMDLLLTSTTNLKKLILRKEFPLCYEGIDYTPSEATVKSVKECFSANRKLEELELQGRPHFLSFVNENLTGIVSFKLKKLVVKIETPVEKILEEHEENFIQFLSHQSQSLEHVYVDACSLRVIKHVFADMPVVKFIRFDIEIRDPRVANTVPNIFDIKELKLKTNEKITQLELGYIARFDELRDYLELAPNVEELLVGHMNTRVLEYAIKQLPSLVSIVYRYDDCDGGCEAAYLSLKPENRETNQSIKLSLCNDFL